jgi:hypothetical protein
MRSAPVTSKMANEMSSERGAGQLGAAESGAWVEVPGGQDIQVPRHNKRDNQFIQSYFEATAPRPLVVP